MSKVFSLRLARQTAEAVARLPRDASPRAKAVEALYTATYVEMAVGYRCSNAGSEAYESLRAFYSWGEMQAVARQAERRAMIALSKLRTAV